MRLPRFSLLSLVLFTLLVGSGVALWMHWPAWRSVNIVHPGLSWEMGFSSDGNYLITNSVSDFKIWNARNGALEFTNLKPTLSSAGFDTTSEQIIVTDRSEGDSLLLNWRTNSVLHRFENIALHGRFGPDFYYANREEGETRKSYLIPLSDLKQRIPFKYGVWDSGFTKSWDTGVSVNESGVVEVYEWPSQKLRYSFTPTERVGQQVVVSPDGKEFAIDSDGLCVFNLSDGKLIRKLPGHPGEGLRTLEYLANGNLISATRDYTMAMWNSTHAEALAKVEFYPELRKLREIDGGNMFVTTHYAKDDDADSSEWVLRVWSSRDLSLIREFPKGVFNFLETPERTIFIHDDGDLYDLKVSQPYAKLPLRPDTSDLHETISPTGEVIMCRIANWRDFEADMNSRVLLIRHRPEARWGIVWLPEFWSTVVFAGLFIWNLRRSRFSR